MQFPKMSLFRGLRWYDSPSVNVSRVTAGHLNAAPMLPCRSQVFICVSISRIGGRLVPRSDCRDQ